MTRRPAVTLMEVLIAMFIMAIGMMALLALFPVGAVSFAQALKDDRCTYASIMSENVAIATNVRYGDPLVNAVLNVPPNPPPVNQPVQLVYVDPAGVGYPVPSMGALGGYIPRIAPSSVYAATFPNNVQSSLIARWFSLPDDITFMENGTPQADPYIGGNVFIDRGRKYTWAYLLRQNPPVWSPNFSLSLKTVQLFAVVYYGRPVSSLSTTPTEWTFTANVFPPPATSPPPYNGLIVPQGSTTAKRGGWLLDVTQNSPYAGNFYRITNIVESPNATTLETQQALQLYTDPTTGITQSAMNIVILDNVAEVFDKGFGWQQ